MLFIGLKVGHASDLYEEILKCALTEGRIVLTQDLEFGAIFAATNASAPSTVLLRTHASLPESIGDQVISVLLQNSWHTSEFRAIRGNWF